MSRPRQVAATSTLLPGSTTRARRTLRPPASPRCARPPLRRDAQKSCPARPDRIIRPDGTQLADCCRPVGKDLGLAGPRGQPLLDQQPKQNYSAAKRPTNRALPCEKCFSRHDELSDDEQRQQ